MPPASPFSACIFRQWLWSFLCLGLLADAAEAIDRQRLWRPIPAKPYVLRGAERRLLDRAERFLADQQWEDATDGLMRLLESDNPSVVAVDERRFVSLSEYCHRLLTRLPAEALARYRALVDVTAESIYRQGVDQRDAERLQEVVDQYFCSSWGDDALSAIGEMALERGDYQAALNAWLAIAGQGSSPDDRLVYPDTSLELADVEARLVLVSIRERDLNVADSKLRRFQRDYPTARGRMGGREVVLSDYLAVLLQQARLRPKQESRPEWKTFAADYQRTNAVYATEVPRPYELLWSREIDNEHLKVFPVVAGGQVFFQDDSAVYALRLTDGQEVFVSRGEMFRSTNHSSHSLGQCRHTLTVTDGQLFGITTFPLGPRRPSDGNELRSTLWSLDLERDGAVSWEQVNEDSQVTFAGAPIVDGSDVYVPIRSNDQTARAGIICYDQSTGRRRWQQWLVQANTPATGWTSDYAGQLLTYDAGVIYANTNLGAIAAVRGTDGQVLWLRTYQRSNNLQNSEPHAYYRGPQPCVFHRGFVYVLPTDSSTVQALDAATGKVIWKHAVKSQAPRLIGVTDEHVILSHQGIEVLDKRTGEQTGYNPLDGIAGWPAVSIRSPHSRVILVRNGLIHSVDGRNADIQYDGIIAPEKGPANVLVAGEYVVATQKNALSVLRLQSETTKQTDDLEQISRE